MNLKHAAILTLFCTYNKSKKPNSQKIFNEIRYAATSHYQKISKGLELVTIPHFLHKFSTKIFLINWQTFSITVCLFYKIFNKMNFCFMLMHFMTS